jgi:hypothetical protein
MVASSAGPRRPGTDDALAGRLLAFAEHSALQSQS